MSDSLVDEVWADLLEHLGGDLRVVTKFDFVDYESRMRDDIRAQYTPDEDRAVVDDTIIKQLSARGSERAFKTGELDGLIRVFEEALVLSWAGPTSEKSGLIVSVDREGDDASLDDLEWCLEYLNEEVAPELT